MSERIRIGAVRTLSDDWYVLRKTTFDYLRSDGQWQTQSRETYDRGNGATILLYDLKRRAVALIRQFRFPTWVNGNANGLLIETPAGLLDNASPAERIREEVEEETGYRSGPVRQVFEAYMSPGSVTEKLYFFVAEVHLGEQISPGGGDASEGEDIEVLELPFDNALAQVASGEIRDAKTILLLQYAALHLFPESQLRLDIAGDRSA